MTDIFTRIKQDHDKACDLMQQIRDTTDRAAKTREDLFEKFKLALWAHHKIEEATFYSNLESKGEDDESLEAKNEHHMDEEEEEFFDLGRKEFSKEEAERLGERFDARKKVVVPALERVDG